MVVTLESETKSGEILWKFQGIISATRTKVSVAAISAVVPVRINKINFMRLIKFDTTAKNITWYRILENYYVTNN
jgi:hypothetical protein